MKPRTTWVVGALIGTMALIWRVLAPVQSTYLSLPRIEQAMQTFKQIDRLVKIRSERDAHALIHYKGLFSEHFPHTHTHTHIQTHISLTNEDT